MATEDITIKTEPLDVDYPVIKEEELIIKSEPNDDYFEESPKTPEAVFENDLLVPKEEVKDDESVIADSNNKSKEDPPSSSTVSSSKQRYPCESCNQAFTSLTGLEKHKRFRCRKFIICHICNQVFQTRDIWQDHMQQHKKQSPVYALRRILPKTPANSTSSKSSAFACHVCDKFFTNSPNLITHIRTHTGHVNFSCKCGESFISAHQLRYHKTVKKCSKKKVKKEIDDSTIKTEPIKEEIPEAPANVEKASVSPNENSTVPQFVPVEIKEEVVDIDAPNPIEFIKVEPTDEIEEPSPEPLDCDDSSTNPMDYDELILEELIERKARSVAKQKAKSKPNKQQSLDRFRSAALEPPTPRVSPTFENTDFEDVIASNTLIVKGEPLSDNEDIEQLLFDETSADNLSQHSNSEKSQLLPDFETMIVSNTVGTFQNQTEVIENLKEEYRKAKKLKVSDETSDDSSQYSSSAVPPVESEPGSVFLELGTDLRLYNQAVRKLNKKYRYIWICPSCPRRYVQRHAFIKHLTTNHQQTNEQIATNFYELRPELYYNSTTEHTFCHLCRVTLADFTSLQKHRKEFHNEDTTTKLQFKCDKCGKYCSTRNTLADHVQANCGTAPQYGCDVCGKKFHTKSTLNLHKTMHTGVLPHQCGYCEKRFRTRGQLTVHTRTHTGERPFPCKVCERRFTHRETLIAHLSRHIDMKRYKCYGCDMFFSCISGLKTHRLTRMNTCGLVKLNARPVGPRVRVIKGNVIFEPQPKINPYARLDQDDSDKSDQKNIISRESDQDQENINTIVKIEPHSMMVDS